MKQLDFGCGESVRKGFEGVDLRPTKAATYVCRAWEITEHVEPQSVDEIYCKNMLQYLTFGQLHHTLQAWHTILKPGGVAQIIVPDFSFWSRCFLNEEPREQGVIDPSVPIYQEALEQLFGKQRESLKEYWDVVKISYDFRFLSGILLKAQFKTVFRVNEERPWEINLLTQKRGAKEEEEAALHHEALEKKRAELENSRQM